MGVGGGWGFTLRTEKLERRNRPSSGNAEPSGQAFLANLATSSWDSSSTEDLDGGGGPRAATALRSHGGGGRKEACFHSPYGLAFGSGNTEDLDLSSGSRTDSCKGLKPLQDLTKATCRQQSTSKIISVRIAPSAACCPPARQVGNTQSA